MSEHVCEFTLVTNSGLVLHPSHEGDVEEVEMHDGGKVRLCKRHRSWQATLSAIADRKANGHIGPEASAVS